LERIWEAGWPTDILDRPHSDGFSSSPA
jgi:hypothetical protein